MTAELQGKGGVDRRTGGIPERSTPLSPSFLRRRRACRNQNARPQRLYAHRTFFLVVVVEIRSLCFFFLFFFFFFQQITKRLARHSKSFYALCRLHFKEENNKILNGPRCFAQLKKCTNLAGNKQKQALLFYLLFLSLSSHDQPNVHVLN